MNLLLETLSICEFNQISSVLLGIWVDVCGIYIVGKELELNKKKYFCLYDFNEIILYLSWNLV